MSQIGGLASGTTAIEDELKCVLMLLSMILVRK